MQAYFWGRATAIAAIMDFKSRGRLPTVESVTKGVGLGKSNMAATINRDSWHVLPENVCIAGYK